MKTKGKGKRKGESKKAIIGIVLAAIMLASVFAVIMPAIADINLLGTGGGAGTGVNATINTTFGGNTTVAGACSYLNFTANVTGLGTLYNASNVTLVFPLEMPLNTSLSDGTINISAATLNAGGGNSTIPTATSIDKVTITKDTRELDFFNSSGWTVADNASSMFWMNISTQYLFAHLGKWSNQTHQINLSTSNTTGYIESRLVNLTVYNMTQNDRVYADVEAPVEHTIGLGETWSTTPGTIVGYNLTLNTTNCGLNEIYNETRITVPSGFAILNPDKRGIKSNVTGWDGVNLTVDGTKVRIWNLTINASDSTTTTFYVYIPMVKASETFDQGGPFKVEFYNQTQNGWNDVDSTMVPHVKTNLSVAPVAENLTVQVIPKETVANAATIYVQAQNSSGVLANTTNVSVRLATSSANALINSSEKKVVELIFGKNYTAAINTTKAGTYTVTAYDLNVTPTPLISGNDTIEYIADTATELVFNESAPTGVVGYNKTLNISAWDEWDNVNTSETRLVYLSVSSPSGTARITYFNEGITYTTTTSGKLVNGNVTVKIYDEVIEDVSVHVWDPEMILSDKTIALAFRKGPLTSIVVSPTQNISRVVGTTVDITAQLADDKGNAYEVANKTINFTLNNNESARAECENGTLLVYSALTNASGMVSTVLTLPTQEDRAAGKNISVFAVVEDDPTVNGTSHNITTVNTTISKINVTWNASASETDNIEKASDQDFLWLNVTLKDMYNNTAEESRVVNYTITSKDPSDMAVMLSKTNETTNATTGQDSLKIRSLDAGTVKITAESLPLTNGTFTAKFYGTATNITAIQPTPSSTTVNESINVTIEAQDAYGTRVEDFSETENVLINVTMTTTVNETSSASVYNVTAYGSSTLWGYNNVTFNMTNGTAIVAINDTKAEEVWVNVTSGTLTPTNTTVTFTANLTKAWLNATNVTASTATVGNNITVAIELCDEFGNRIDYDLAPIIVTLNNTWANITWTNLSDASGTGTNEVTGILLNGYAQVKVKSDTTAGVLNVTPKCPAYPSLADPALGKITNNTLTFQGGPYTAIKVTTDRDAIVANGTDSATITAQLYDEYGNTNDSGNVIINLHKDLGTFASYTNTTTAGFGNVTTTLNSTTKGTATVYATTTDTAITGGVSTVNATVGFVGEPYKFTMDVSPTTLAKNTNATITVQVVDIGGESVAMNRSFNLSIAGATSSGFTNQYTYSQNGTWTNSFTSAAAGNVTVWMNTTDGLVAAPNVTVTFYTFPDKIDLRAGWNLVSVPKTLNESCENPTTLFNLGASELVWYYDAATTSWKGKTELTKVEPCKGYWVYKSAAETVSLTYKTMTGAIIPPSVDLVANWNMIGHTSVDDMWVNASLTSLITSYAKYDILLKYNATGWHYASCKADTGVPVTGDFTQMEPGQGYWIGMKESATYRAVSV